MRKFAFLITLLSSLYCKADGIPPNIPEGAHYNKRTNLYQIVKDGVSYSYFKDGKLYERCEINELGKNHGLCETFLHSTGQKISWGRFQNGQRDGEWVWTFEDGSVFLKQEFTYGKKKDFWIPVEEWGNEDGKYSRFYSDGSLEEIGFYDSGYRSGNWKKYFPDGRLESTGSYKKGKRVGSWKHFYPNGKPEAKEDFDSEGKLLNRTTYYPNGKVWCTVSSNLLKKCEEP